MTLRTYRLGDKGEHLSKTSLSTFDGSDLSALPLSLAWPACRCPRCRTSSR
jgi:hypothetical protein